MTFDIKQKGRKNDSDKSLIRLPKSSVIMAHGISKTIFLSSGANELCDRLKLSNTRTSINVWFFTS